MTGVQTCALPICTACELAVDGMAGVEAMRAALARGYPYQLALIDMKMPRMNGIELAQHLAKTESPPAVIFVTAHDEYAVRAFEVNALDYLMKPVRAARLAQALRKAAGTLRGPSAEALARSNPQARRYLSISERGRLTLVPVADIVYLRAELKYITVRTATRSYILDGSLSELEDKYKRVFLRVHRNALVARRAVRAVEKHFDEHEGEGWAVRLHGLDEVLVISRRQLAAVRELVAGPS